MLASLIMIIAGLVITALAVTYHYGRVLVTYGTLITLSGAAIGVLSAIY